MTEKPKVDFEAVVKASGMPVTEAEVRERFNAIVSDEGIITNTSRMSPFWRLITAIVEGFINIFDRLGIGYVELLERQPGIDWDVILVRVTDSQIADNTQLLIQIIRQYGRTCRRYQFEVITSEKLAIRAGWDQGEYVVYPATLAGTETQSATFSASL